MVIDGVLVQGIVNNLMVAWSNPKTVKFFIWKVGTSWPLFSFLQLNLYSFFTSPHENFFLTIEARPLLTYFSFIALNNADIISFWTLNNYSVKNSQWLNPTNSGTTRSNCQSMELFSSRRWRLERPKQKAVVFMFNSNKLCKTCMAWFHWCLTVGPIQLLVSFY